MPQRDLETRQEVVSGEIVAQENPAADSASAANPPTAYIAACGTLCDAFWWARPSLKREKSSG
jgi:hypothetical protein